MIIPHSKPTLDDEEIFQINEVLRSSMIAQGERVTSFENDFCLKFGFGHAAAASSGTAALHLTLLALGVKAGDEVVMPSFVCSALLNTVRYVGAVPVVADCDPDTFNINPDDIGKRITSKTKAIIAAHMFGLAAEMDRLLEFDIPVIEDCAQAVGGQWNGEPLGTLGKASVFSFYATKVMTTGEGGMIVSASDEFIDCVRDLREYDQKKDYKLRYNYKMTDIQAAMGIEQLKKLPAFIDRRREIARQYSKAFEKFGFQFPLVHPGHIYFRYIIKLEPGADAKEWIRAMADKGVQCELPVFKPIHQYLGLTGYPHSEELHRRLISIPIYPSLTGQQIETVIWAMSETHRELAGRSMHG